MASDAPLIQQGLDARGEIGGIRGRSRKHYRQSNAGWDPFRDATPRTSCEDACSAQTTYILSEFLSDARRGPRLAIARALARKGLLLVGDVDYDFTRLRPAEAFPRAFFDAELTRPEGIDILL